MSENQNRTENQFAKFDTMETDALEQLLRLDTEAPEGAGLDTETLLYIAEVLVQREKKEENTGNKAQKAWESFQEHYMPVESKKPAAGRYPRRWVAAAAAAVLVILIPLSAQALSWGQIWDVIARWAKETFSFVSSGNADVSEPNPEDQLEYTSLQDMLQRNGLDGDIIPPWLPDGFSLEKLEKDMTPIQELYKAIYLNGGRELRIQVRTHLVEDIQNAEITGEPIESHDRNGITYYVFENENMIQVFWETGSYECIISGDISIEEAKLMIDSIRKG